MGALHRGRRDAPLRPWLFRIAHNESISLLRRRRAAPGAALTRHTREAAPSAAERAGERARLELLVADLADVPPRARSALLMRELNGLGHEEIAIALGTSVGAAKQAIFDARRCLSELAEGRAMACEEIQRTISDGDRRALRGRRVRAHLRDCASCAAFATAIGTRQVEMRAIVPVLPAAASAVVLARAVESAIGGGTLGAGAAGTGGAATGGAAAASTAGKAAGLAIVSKGFATASVLATAAVMVGGVAAVVRIDASRTPAKSHSAKVGRPGVVAARRVAAHATASSASSAAGAGSTAFAARGLAGGGPPRPVRVFGTPAARAAGGGTGRCRPGGLG